MAKIKAKCEVVAHYSDRSGQEVRFYRDGVCVKTLQLMKGDADYGRFSEGETYDVRPDEEEEAAT